MYLDIRVLAVWTKKPAPKTEGQVKPYEQLLTNGGRPPRLLQFEINLQSLRQNKEKCHHFLFIFNYLAGLASISITLFRILHSLEYKAENIKGMPPISKKHQQIKKRKKNNTRAQYLRAYGM